MTSPTSAASRHNRRPRRGFTLIEMLVVIGIILILMAFAIPMVMKAYQSSTEARIAADFQTIGIGLEAFKSDHGDYPRPSNIDPDPADLNPTTYYNGINTGFALLTRAMYGPGGTAVPGAYDSTQTYAPGQAVTDTLQYIALTAPTGAPSADPESWALFPHSLNPISGYTDGHDGVGFAMRPDGKATGPYLQEGAFKLRGLAMLDSYGNPILYFPGRTARPNLTVAGGYLPPAAAATAAPDVFVPPASLYDPYANLFFFTRSSDADNTFAHYRIHAMLGDYTADGALGAGEEQKADKPYLLWSTGRDGVFGPVDGTAPNVISDGVDAGEADINRSLADACDDVTNFSE